MKDQADTPTGGFDALMDQPRRVLLEVTGGRTTLAVHDAVATVEGLTIDGAHSKDLDDAFWVTVIEDGYRVDVSVTDVDSAVPAGGELDRRARERKETRYLRAYNDPMLPAAYADDRCSLRPGRARPVVVTRLFLDAAMQVVRAEVDLAVLKSAARLSHRDVDQVLMGSEHPLNTQLALCRDVAMAFYERRRSLGACALYDVASHLYADEEGVLRKYDGDFFHAQLIVQEMMIAANEQQALWVTRADVPYLYRNHEATQAAPARETMLAQVQQALTNPALLPIVHERMHTWMRRATYGTELLGHFGLNLAGYAHTTSPIRRYVDLVNQRVVKALLAGAPAPYTVDELQAIAGEVNAWKDEQRDRRDGAAKAQTIAERRQAIAKGEGFAALTPERFTQLLKRAVKDDVAPEALVAEVVRRAGNRKLWTLDLCYLLYESGPAWAVAVPAALAQLDTQPHAALQVMDIARARLDMVYEPPVFETPGPLFHAWALVRRPDGFTRTPVPATATTKKGACAAAAVAWLRARHAGTLIANDASLVVPADASTVVVQVGDRQVKVEAAVPSTANAVGAVQEFCQMRRTASPTYDFATSGPPHMPTVTCTVRLRLRGRELVAHATAGSKKDAKREAANALLPQLPA